MSLHWIHNGHIFRQGALLPCRLGSSTKNYRDLSIAMLPFASMITVCNQARHAMFPFRSLYNLALPSATLFLMLLSVACVDAPPGTSNNDAGSSESGEEGSDGGTETSDGGAVLSDGGAGLSDGGAVLSDGGAVLSDGGAVLSDGGSMIDSGADGGLPPCQDPLDPMVHYIGTSPEVCQLIDFDCLDDQTMFSDPCGCGCLDLYEASMRDDCKSNIDCEPDFACIRIPEEVGAVRFCVDVGPKPFNDGACESGMPLTTGCCADDSCIDNNVQGYCVDFNAGYCGGPPPLNINECRFDLCTTDNECGAENACVPGGVLGKIINTCTATFCKTDADCATRSGGQCRPLSDLSCGDTIGFYCTYEEDECRSNADCPNGEVCTPQSNNDGTTCEAFIPLP
jgi:hypothetical protein